MPGVRQDAVACRTTGRSSSMGADDKLGNKAEELKGKAKETAGRRHR
jgi:hypothetical protein